MKFKIHIFCTFVLSLLLIESVKAQAQVQQTALCVNNTEIYNAALPARDWCPSDQIREEALARDPKLRLEQEKFEESYRRSVTNNPISPYALRGGAVHTLPVVVHIFHSGQAVGSLENPSDARVNETIQSTTNLFRHTSGRTFPNNPYSGVDTEIELCLSKVDPAGNATSGIKRYNLPGFAVLPAAFDANLLAPYMWDRTKYTNLIVVTSAPPDNNWAGVYYGGTLDFVMVVSGALGPNALPLGGLWVHELGHYFGLPHIFSGTCTNSNCLTDGDRICDTPPKNVAYLPSGATCANPSNTCMTDADDLSTNNPFRPVANGGLGDRNDALENYMDYTNGCWAGFTQGQKARMKVNLATRTSQTNNFGACTPIPNACAAPVELTASVNNTNLALSWSENATATSWQIKYGPTGFNPSTSGTSVIAPSKTYNFNVVLNTNYDWYVRGVCPTQPSGYSNFSTVSTFSTPPVATYCNLVYTTVCATDFTGALMAIKDFILKKTSDNTTVINNSNTGCLGSISDYTAIIGNVTVGANYNFTINHTLRTGGTTCSGGSDGVWVDWNDDKDFDDANETIYLSAAYESKCNFTGNFTVPGGTINGAKKLRIRRINENYNTDPSCVTSSSGEAEEYTLNVTGGILPIELLSFKAQNREGGNLLTWQTASEINTSHFDIERSYNGIKFNKIGELKAQNKAANYTYLDKAPFGGWGAYYRLTINDLDGKTTVSKIISIEQNSDNSIKITRNTEGSILIETNNLIELITITNTIGQVIKSTKDKQILINDLTQYLRQRLYITIK